MIDDNHGLGRHNIANVVGVVFRVAQSQRRLLKLVHPDAELDLLLPDALLVAGVVVLMSGATLHRTTGRLATARPKVGSLSSGMSEINRGGLPDLDAKSRSRRKKNPDLDFWSRSGSPNLLEKSG